CSRRLSPCAIGSRADRDSPPASPNARSSSYICGSERGSGAEPIMSKRQLDALMWAQACAAMERAERLRRQFFHHGTPYWEAPVDVFESEDALIILVALPGVELETISVTLSAGTLT